MSPLLFLACADSNWAGYTDEQRDGIVKIYVEHNGQLDGVFSDFFALGFSLQETQGLQQVFSDGKIDEQDNFKQLAIKVGEPVAEIYDGRETRYCKQGGMRSERGHCDCWDAIRFTPRQIASLWAIGDRPQKALEAKQKAMATNG